MIRETIYAALFARVAACTWAPLSEGGATTWAVSSRKLRHWDDTDKSEMPALFTKQVSELEVRQRNLPSKWTLKIELYVYVATLAQQDKTVIPASQLNPILDSIQKALQPQPSVDQSLERNTLGGLVDECKQAGEILNFEGDLGDLGALIIPVEIVVPN